MKPILLYNAGTWALTAQEWAQLNDFHRKQLRRILGIRWPQTISNEDLYARCKEVSIEQTTRNARWRLLGHTLRMNKKIPARKAMNHYFEVSSEKGFQGRPKTTLPLVIRADIKQINQAVQAMLITENSNKHNRQLMLPCKALKLPEQFTTIEDLNKLQAAANRRANWQKLTVHMHELFIDCSDPII